jgi:hypothetical protein
MRPRGGVAVVGGGVLTLALAVACVSDSSAQSAGSSRPLVQDDTAAVGRLLNVVRGADALLCELTVRQVDQHGSWSRYGSMSGGPLETDSAAAALIRWIQHEHNDPAVVPRLRTALRDNDACVRRLASSFLSRVDHASAKSALLDGLDDSRAEVREVSAYGLGMAEHVGALDELISKLKDASPKVRRASAWALGALENKKAIAPLMAVLTSDSDAKVRQSAAWAIGNIK